MDFLKGKTHSGSSAQQSGGSHGLMGKMNQSLGGGKKSEQNEDALDKGVDFVQERFGGQGPQNNESAIEQAKDEQISDAIRRGWKGAIGKDLPVRDK